MKLLMYPSILSIVDIPALEAAAQAIIAAEKEKEQVLRQPTTPLKQPVAQPTQLQPPSTPQSQAQAKSVQSTVPPQSPSPMNITITPATPTPSSQPNSTTTTPTRLSHSRPASFIQLSHSLQHLREIGRCVFVFIARDACELGLNEGEMVEVFARTEGWLYGRKRGGKTFGM